MTVHRSCGTSADTWLSSKSKKSEVECLIGSHKSKASMLVFGGFDAHGVVLRDLTEVPQGNLFPGVHSSV